MHINVKSFTEKMCLFLSRCGTVEDLDLDIEIFYNNKSASNFVNKSPIALSMNILIPKLCI